MAEFLSRRPVTLLTPFTGIQGLEFSYDEGVEPHLFSLARVAREKLEAGIAIARAKGGEVPANGDLALVQYRNPHSPGYRYDTLRRTFSVVTGGGKERFYDYLASAFAYREDHSYNPIMPFAVSATLVTPKGEVFFELRSMSLTDFPGKAHVFGGACRPGESPDAAIRRALRMKFGLNGTRFTVEWTGAGLENLNHILELFCVVRLSEEETSQFSRAKYFREDYPDATLLHLSFENVLQLLGYGMERWNPSGYLNLLCALAHLGQVCADEASEFLDEQFERLTTEPYQHVHPAEQYLALADQLIGAQAP